MSSKISPIIKPEELLVLKQSPNFVLIDARAGVLEKHPNGHLEGAQPVDLNSQMADIKPNAADGGRHPLPSLAQFAQLLTALGITPLSKIVVYDDKNGANAAARFWWMLKSIGHPHVQILDGGMDAAIAKGYPLSISRISDVGFRSDKSDIRNLTSEIEWLLPMADISEVEKATHDDNHLIIDVREEGRYKGEFEPLDLIAGHIPNAVNIPFSSNLDSDGFFLSPSELREKYEKALAEKKPENVIVHCGSGVTACHTLLAMDYAGMDIPKLYVGSWSEWSRNDCEMVTKA
jgi:thiosulfate/3-mercaptopyruvate sulfurtransferase